MKRICVVCEGQTEETFVRTVLAPSFYQLNLNLIGETIETSSGHKGGALSYERVRKHLRNRLRQSSAPIVTTLFDLYRLDSKFPGYNSAQAQNGLEQRLEILNKELHREIVDLSECAPERFIPFIQPYEFEALLFSDIDTLVSIEPEWANAIHILSKIRMNAKSPEHINDSPETKPAAHLERELRNPSYRKRLHGPIIAEKIGLTSIEAECRFFRNWIARIKQLSEI